MAWKLKLKLPGGHRIFCKDDQPSGYYSFADDSGRTPDSTDDGPLWFSVTDPITVGNNLCSVPVRMERVDHDELFTVGITCQDAIVLATELGMGLSMGGVSYTVSEASAE